MPHPPPPPPPTPSSIQRPIGLKEWTRILRYPFLSLPIPISNTFTNSPFFLRVNIFVCVVSDSCVPVSYPCSAGTDKLVDPCDCQTFYECVTGGYKFVKRSCARGLFWNHLNNKCENQNDIAIKQKLCIPITSWSRCANSEYIYL